MLIYFLQYEFISLFRLPKDTEAENLFGPSRLHAEGEKVYGLLLTDPKDLKNQVVTSTVALSWRTSVVSKTTC